MHAAASAGSAGHGAKRARHWKTPAIASIVPAAVKSPTLCSTSHTSCGTAPTREASAAPAPIATSAAGSAQHTWVPRLVKTETDRKFDSASDARRGLNRVSNRTSTVPRHREINDHLAVKICRDLAIPAP